MTTLTDFSRDASSRFLQSIVFVDDEIYVKNTGSPVELTSTLHPLKSPFATNEGSGPQPTPQDSEATGSAEASGPPEYRPKSLVESFARKGMVCALYQPEDKFTADASSEIYKLCDRADVVILDWDLFNQDGRNIIPLVKNLADAGQSSVPHHVRLCVIYTLKPDLLRVANSVFEALRSGQNDQNVTVTNETTVTKDATRIVVLGKPGVSGRPDQSKAFEVMEADLADRVIDEFAKMNSGMLASYVLHGMAAVRRSTKRIVDKFSREMDAPFVLNRALVAESEEAFDQLPELIAEEVLAVVQDAQISQETIKNLASETAVGVTLDLQSFNWPDKDGRPLGNTNLAVRYLAGGAAAIRDDSKVKVKDTQIDKFHAAMGCAASKGDQKLASLYSIRTKYANQDRSPVLMFGTVVRFTPNAQGLDDTFFAVCLMPICDSLRLSNKTPFPFWKLSSELKNGSRGFSIQLPDGSFQVLAAEGKPYEKLIVEHFTPGAAGTVTAEQKDGRFIFGGSKDLEWIAQLKPAHAQRIASDVGQKLSRVGLAEAEWLRLRCEK